VLLLPFLLTAAPAQADELRAACDEVVSGHHARGAFQGVALVSVSGEIVYRGAFGLASEEQGVPNAPDTRFRIGSVTKPFSAALVLSLVEEGKLALDDRVSEHLPWFPAELGDRLIVHDLLTHSSGMPRILGRPDTPRLMRMAHTRKEIVLGYCLEPLVSEPGTTFGYTNAGYIVLAAIVEELTGMSWGEAMNAFLGELGLEDTRHAGADEVVPGLASGYVRPAGELRRGALFDWDNAQGSGSMLATADDLVRFADLVHEDGGPFEVATRATLFTPRHGGYACGWLVGELRSEELDAFLLGFASPAEPAPDATLRVTAHPGDLAGFQAMLTRVEHGGGHVTVALLDNHDDRTLGRITLELVRLALAAGER
jgi:CubicO group peptidase (beta-lactamase class C family)